MDYPLTSDSIISSTLRGKSFLLVGFTYGTVALFAVHAVVFVALWAVCFASVLCGNPVAAQDIFLRRQSAKVVWIDAARVIANVVNHGFVRYITYTRPIRNAMSTSIPATEPKYPVAITIGPAYPEPTTIGFVDLLYESLPFRWGHSVHAT